MTYMDLPYYEDTVSEPKRAMNIKFMKIAPKSCKLFTYL